ncbi:hypothetical protein BWI96_06450 [Siphonobacter sp. SORGH_AS_0500]|nr:hypothetical protein BWI96_06450 [Siphonobacter sp. SORGH_AS_0500]
MSMNLFLLRVSEARLKDYQLNGKVSERNPLVEDLDHASTIFTKGEFTSIKKSWEGIVFLMTGKPFEEALTEPFTTVITGRKSLEVALPTATVAPRYLTSTEVIRAHQMLRLITNEILMDRYNAGVMNDLGIYPGNWEAPEAKSYLLRGFDHLKDFYVEAATQKQAVIMFLA